MRPSQSLIRWGEILDRTARAIYGDDCFGWAAELAFFWFLAVFPALLFVVALAGSLPVQHLIDVVVASLARVAARRCARSSCGNSSSRSHMDHPAAF